MGKKKAVQEGVKSIKTVMLKEFLKIVHTIESAKAKNVTADPNLRRSVTACRRPENLIVCHMLYEERKTLEIQSCSYF